MGPRWHLLRGLTLRDFGNGGEHSKARPRWIPYASMRYANKTYRRHHKQVQRRDNRQKKNDYRGQTNRSFASKSWTEPEALT